MNNQIYSPEFKIDYSKSQNPFLQPVFYSNPQYTFCFAQLTALSRADTQASLYPCGVRALLPFSPSAIISLIGCLAETLTPQTLLMTSVFQCTPVSEHPCMMSLNPFFASFLKPKTSVLKGNCSKTVGKTTPQLSGFFSNQV